MRCIDVHTTKVCDGRSCEAQTSGIWRMRVMGHSLPSGFTSECVCHCVVLNMTFFFTLYGLAGLFGGGGMYVRCLDNCILLPKKSWFLKHFSFEYCFQCAWETVQQDSPCTINFHVPIFMWILAYHLKMCFIWKHLNANIFFKKKMSVLAQKEEINIMARKIRICFHNILICGHISLIHSLLF